MSSQMTARDEAVASLQMLQYDYADGVGNYGPVITAFSEVLAEYRSRFHGWSGGYYGFSGEDPKQKGGLSCSNAMLVTAAATAAVFLLVSSLFDSVWVMAAFYIAAGIALGKVADDSSWVMKLLVVTLPFLLLAKPFEFDAGIYDRYMFWAILAAYVLSTAKVKREEAKDREQWLASKEQSELGRAQHEADKAWLEAKRQQLVRMAPALREEFYAVRQQMLEEFADVLEEEDLGLFDKLPPFAWWDVSYEEMDRVVSQFRGRSGNQGGVIWETRWVQRKCEDAFQDAGEEFSPLMPRIGTAEDTPRLYQMLRDGVCANGGTVLDFVSRGTGYSMESKTIYYEDYKHSDMTRFAAEMSWLGLGNQIDQARQNNEISDQGYRELKNEYFWGSVLVNDAINKKEQKESVEYHQVKTHTNIWTGQLLLIEDNDPNGGYAIMDYRCRPEHLIENLKTLKDLPITRVMGDVYDRNPVIMAKIHHICGACR